MNVIEILRFLILPGCPKLTYRDESPYLWGEMALPSGFQRPKPIFWMPESPTNRSLFVMRIQTGARSLHI